jgi:hypothetical protein
MIFSEYIKLFVKNLPQAFSAPMADSIGMPDGLRHGRGAGHPELRPGGSLPGRSPDRSLGRRSDQPGESPDKENSPLGYDKVAHARSFGLRRMRGPKS